MPIEAECWGARFYANPNKGANDRKGLCRADYASPKQSRQKTRKEGYLVAK